MRMSLLLLPLLFCFLQPTLSTPHALSTSSCCFKFFNAAIPLDRIVSFSWTNSSCPKRAIVFQTIAGRKICVDPKSSWVSSSHVDKENIRTTTATAMTRAKTLSTTL
ncbi:monocyte chemotactic protein 1B-like [Danio aesculapii]|uniref:monocyte chemotactic protein 1B-like n=1 Tax=Danio aesculapii TaxID=1142201 RepID=UPI0024BFF62D|nr:monocyte chemotactic protein 1B-like [Danio aesculapii]